MVRGKVNFPGVARKQGPLASLRDLPQSPGRFKAGSNTIPVPHSYPYEVPRPDARYGKVVG